MTRTQPSDYDYKRFRVVRATSKVSTVSLPLGVYLRMLAAMPFRNQAAFARTVRQLVLDIDAEGGPPRRKLSAEVLKRLRVRYGVLEDA